MLFSQETTLVGDVDCSGEVNSEDASLILQFVTNVLDSLPCEANMTGLNPEQLQEMISVMNEQLSINYSISGGGNYPIMISSISLEEMQYGDALIYCADLVENSYNDWFLPNLNQLVYSVSGGCTLPDERTENPLWTASPASSVYYLMSTLSESGQGGFNASYGAGPHYCRCVRFGAGETSENSNGSLSSGLLVSGNSEQPITMIGPMYLKDEFPDLVSYNNDELYYFHGIRFCAQLEYAGYNDWFLPTPQQIENYLETNSVGFSIPNLGIDDAGYYFMLKKGHNNSFQVSNALRYLTFYYLNISGEEGMYFSSDYASSKNCCFCVR